MSYTLEQAKNMFYNNEIIRNNFDYHKIDQAIRLIETFINDMEDLENKSNEATSLHYDNCYLELEYYQDLAEKDNFYKEQLNKATKEICEMYDIPLDDYLSGTYEFEDDEYDEFLIDLVNTIAEYYGIDNHLGY